MNCLNSLKLKNYHYFCEYNSNASIIACGNSTSLYIVYPDIKKKYLIPKKCTDYWWDCIAFHPNGSILTTLSSPNSILCHWDVQTRQPIDEISLSPETDHLKNRSLCLSPDGTELMIMLLSKCIIVPISFDVLYPPSTQKKLCYLLFLLKNYTPHSETVLPKDIITLLMLTILTAFRY